MVGKRNILILHTAALGDFILTWPLAMALGRLHPQSRIVYVTHHSKGLLASRLLYTDAASIDTGGWHTLFASSPAISADVQQILERTSAVYSFISFAGDQVTRNLEAISPGVEVCCFNTNIPADYPSHITAFYQGQLTSRPALYSTYAAMLQSINKRGLVSSKGRYKRILLHPGAGSPRKCWPMERYTELATRLKADHHSIAFVLGEAELERLANGTLGELNAIAPVLRPDSYLALSDELLSSGHLITNDNGPGHLAGILGLGVISLFGPTNPAQWHPLGPRIQTLHNASIDDITVDQVVQAIT